MVIRIWCCFILGGGELFKLIFLPPLLYYRFIRPLHFANLVDMELFISTLNIEMVVAVF